MVSTTTWKNWGKTEYSAAIPGWPQPGLLLMVAIATGSDINYLRQRSRDSLTIFLIIEVIFTYGAIGLSLISARASVIVYTVAMGISFATQRPIFALLAVGVITLVSFAMCQARLTAIRCFLSFIWIILTTLISPIAEVSNPMTFWWVAFLTILGCALTGLALKHLVIHTARVHAELQRIEAHQETIRKGERHDLARGLHDVVAHHITVITMQIMARRNSYDPDQLHEILGIIDGSAREALSELRALLDVLRPDEGDDSDIRSLPDKIVTDPSVGDQIVQRVNSLTEVGIRAHKQSVDPRIESLSFSLKTTCARIVQESATNILKHARHGARCSIVVGFDPTEVVIMITNNRIKPHDPPRSSGCGLTGLRKRVAAVGGSCTTGQQGDKWVMEAHIPVHNTGHTTPSSKKWDATQPETSETEQSVIEEKEIS